LSDIDIKSKEIIAIDEQISKKQDEINNIENKYRNITTEHKNKKKKIEKFENDSLHHVNTDIKSLKSSLKNAKKLEKDYSRTNCSGMSSKEFRAEKLGPKLRVKKKSWDLDADDEIVTAGAVAIILTVIACIWFFVNGYDPAFECTDGDGSVYW